MLLRHASNAVAFATAACGSDGTAGPSVESGF